MRAVAHHRLQASLLPAIGPLITYSSSEAHLVIALVLDPRYRDASKLMERLVNEKEDAISLFKKYITLDLMPLMKAIQKSKHNADDGDDPSPFESIFGHIAPQDESHVEFLRYVNLKITDDEKRELNVLEWWQKRKEVFPVLSKLALHILGIPATQIECERVFSVAGIITRHRRSKTKADLVDMIMRLNQNLPIEHTGLKFDDGDVESDVDELDDLEDEESDESGNDSPQVSFFNQPASPEPSPDLGPSPKRTKFA